MNVARSTFVRRGYLLTALAVAVLVFASSGTAWAQTTTASSRFTSSSGTLQEGANTTDLSKPRPLKVIIKRTTKTKNDPYNAAGPHLTMEFDYNCVIRTKWNVESGGSGTRNPGSGTSVPGIVNARR